MEISYKGRYTRSGLARPVTADVVFTASGLKISYTHPENGYASVEWSREKIIRKQYASSVISLHYGDAYPYEELDVTDRDFIRAAKDHFELSRFKQVHERRGASWIAFLLLSLAGFLALCYFVLLPWFGDVAAGYFPKTYEISIGRQLFEATLANEQVDTAATADINRFFKQLEAGDEYPVKIAVVKGDLVNAFALPGGGIIVYDEMLKRMKRPEELAALLSHEYSHVSLKHATRGMFRSVAGYALLSLLFGDMQGVSGAVLRNGDQLRSLSYSRKFEHEADENGLKIMQESRVNPEGMTSLFKVLKEEQKTEVAEWLSTHPDLDNRIAFTEEFARSNPYTPEKNDSLAYYFNRIASQKW